jgi:hypothetical protein
MTHPKSTGIFFKILLLSPFRIFELCSAFIRDEKRDLQLNLMIDHAHGTASLNNGQIELMLHRRLKFNDGKGLEEVQFFS